MRKTKRQIQIVPSKYLNYTIIAISFSHTALGGSGWKPNNPLHQRLVVKVLPAQELRALGQLRVRTQSQHSFVVSPRKELVHIGSGNGFEVKEEGLEHTRAGGEPSLAHGPFLHLTTCQARRSQEEGLSEEPVLECLEQPCQEPLKLGLRRVQSGSEESCRNFEVSETKRPQHISPTPVGPDLQEVPCKILFGGAYMKLCSARQILTVFNNMLIAGCLCLFLEISLYLTFYHTQSQSQFSCFRCR